MSDSTTSKRPLIIGGILFSFIILLIAICSSQIFYNTKVFNEKIFFLARLKIWLCLFLVYLYSIKIEKQNFLLWEEQKYSFTFYLKLIAKIFLTLFFMLFLVTLPLKINGVNEFYPKMGLKVILLKKNNLLLLFTVFTAGITEELINRGYIHSRLEALTNNKNVAITASSLLFGILHYTYGNFYQIIGPFVIGLVFAFYYSKYRNIKILIICHILWNLMALLIKTHL
jgi:membrane protease YdiL (CAAX protease family)